MHILCVTVEIINMITNIIMTIIALLALIFGIIYINKKLKIYIYQDNNRLIIQSIDKGNTSCCIKKVFCTTNFKENSLIYENNSITNEISIDINILQNRNKIHFKIIDNFGRIYRKTIKIKGGI